MGIQLLPFTGCTMARSSVRQRLSTWSSTNKGKCLRVAFSSTNPLTTTTATTRLWPPTSWGQPTRPSKDTSLRSPFQVGCSVYLIKVVCNLKVLMW
ncbi:hypothetical protein CIB84_015030 [Bambusicola thoracicus]|uniref:Uncharacterized protein n=1 Tax=Bambusicola thoracicus TaxID=9083 RepID=A0A2P4SAU5_BAMTH|nr:hypothetical protein CIB84_015030 [Bambusicola thoracicus]